MSQHPLVDPRKAPDSRRWRVDTKSPPCPICESPMIFATSVAGYHLQCGSYHSHFGTFEQWLTKCRRKYLTFLAYRAAYSAAVEQFNTIACENMLPWRLKDDAERACLYHAIEQFNDVLEQQLPT